jgi:hypothetical protein
VAKKAHKGSYGLAGGAAVNPLSDPPGEKRDADYEADGFEVNAGSMTTPTHPPTHPPNHTHTNPHTHPHPPTHTHTPTHTNPHTHTHIHTHTHTHPPPTHTRIHHPHTHASTLAARHPLLTTHQVLVHTHTICFANRSPTKRWICPLDRQGPRSEVIDKTIDTPIPTRSIRIHSYIS